MGRCLLCAKPSPIPRLCDLRANFIWEFLIQKSPKLFFQGNGNSSHYYTYRDRTWSIPPRTFALGSVRFARALQLPLWVFHWRHFGKPCSGCDGWYNVCREVPNVDVRMCCGARSWWILSVVKTGIVVYGGYRGDTDTCRRIPAFWFWNIGE